MDQGRHPRSRDQDWVLGKGVVRKPDWKADQQLTVKGSVGHAEFGLQVMIGEKNSERQSRVSSGRRAQRTPKLSEYAGIQDTRARGSRHWALLALLLTKSYLTDA